MTESEDLGVRTATQTATDSSVRRRSANSSAEADEGSSHWTSSIATSSARRPARWRSDPSRAAATARESAARGPGSSSKRATRSARACGGGSAGSTSSSEPSSRSESPANASSPSERPGRVLSTWYPAARPSSTTCRQTVVLPIPGSPSMRSTRGSESLSARKPATTASSSSRPTISSAVMTARYR